MFVAVRPARLMQNEIVTGGERVGRRAKWRGEWDIIRKGKAEG